MVMKALVEGTTQAGFPEMTPGGALKVEVRGGAASDGTSVPVSSLAQSLVYDAAGRVSGIDVVYNTVTYRKTLTYNAAGQLATVSMWEAQP